jgi:hypothetical protein
MRWGNRKAVDDRPIVDEQKRFGQMFEYGNLSVPTMSIGMAAAMDAERAWGRGV